MGSKAVVIGVNYYIGLSTLRCLGRKGIYTVACEYDRDAYGLKSKYINEVLYITDMKIDRGAFIQELIEYGKKQAEKPLLIPCHDNYVQIIDEYLEELREVYLIPQAKKGLYTQVINKDTLWDLAAKHNVLVPPTISSSEPNLFEKVDSDIGYPCIVKPVDSPAFTKAFRKKVFIVEDPIQLEASLKKCRDQQLEVMVQKIIKGFDDHMYTFDAYVDQAGEVTHYATAQKLRQWPINFGASVFTRQRFVPEIVDVGSKFLQDIGWRGFAEIEFKKEENTENFYLIEINTRITNFNCMLEKIGLNFPYITYQELTGNPENPQAIIHDTKYAFCYFFEDFMASRQYVKTGQLKWSKIIRDFFAYKKAYAIWDSSDTKPFFKYMGMMFGKVFRKIKG